MANLTEEVVRRGVTAPLGLRPTPRWARIYRSRGVWRDQTPVSDLRRWRRKTPDAVAITAHRTEHGVRHLTYREYAAYVERFAGALHELGVRRGDVVAIQLPNWWQVSTLVLACARIGAVTVPITTSIRPRELERMLAMLGASVCVTVDRWLGFDHSAALAEIAPRLPHLRHRVVLGDHVQDGEVDFVRHFEDVPWEQWHGISLDDPGEDPDQVSLVTFTSGTTGSPKAVLHTFNTFHAGCSPIAIEDELGPDDRLFTPHPLTHGWGVKFGVLLPLLAGARSVVMDTWEPDTALRLLVSSGATAIVATPAFLSELTAVARQRCERLPSVRRIVTGAVPVPPEVITEVGEWFRVAPQTAWGMSEVIGGTRTRITDPVDWPTRSDGCPRADLEIDLRGDGEITPERPARLFVRGASVCLATVNRDTGATVVLAEHDHGWYDTGDIVVPDGRDGIRLVGRTGDRIGGLAMIPVLDVEQALRRHPAVREVALVGYPDPQGGELACAVVVPDAPVTLADLRHHLATLQMTEWYRPSRLEILPALPRNTLGKVEKDRLRRWLRDGTALDPCPPG